jgi:hypothetical protein
MTDFDITQKYCEAKTWAQAQSGTWAGSHGSNGCSRKAKHVLDGHHCCTHHYNKPPGFGWNN